MGCGAARVLFALRVRSGDPAPSWHLNLNDCFLAGAEPRRVRPAGLGIRVGKSLGSYMRSNAGLVQALWAPLALNAQALRALLAQNQLRLSAMVDMEGPDGRIVGFTFITIGEVEANMLRRELESWGLEQED